MHKLPPEHCAFFFDAKSCKMRRELRMLLDLSGFPSSETMQLTITETKFPFVLIKHGFQLIHVMSMPFHQVLTCWILDDWKVDDPAVDGVQTTAPRQEWKERLAPEDRQNEAKSYGMP